MLIFVPSRLIETETLVSLVSRVILFLRIGLFLMLDAGLIARLDNLENPKNISKSMLFISCHSAIIFV